MKFYFAPMEGVTGVNYRSIASKAYPFMDAYYAPFIQPNRKKVFAPKEKQDILPENNAGMCLVPQVLTNSSDGFLRVADALFQLGYTEVNLNLGCPSQTVVSKGKGSGMLEDLDALRLFLDAVFKEEHPYAISVKTRLGYDEQSDIEELFSLLAAYPFSKVITHARFRTDYYNGEARVYEYTKAMDCFKGKPVERVYNGDIYSNRDYERLIKGEAKNCIDSVMIGRGLLMNPALVREIRYGDPLTKENLQTFEQLIYLMYRSKNLGERNTLCKMKEIWTHWRLLFDPREPELQKIKKANRFFEYEVAVKRLFETEKSFCIDPRENFRI